MSDQEKAGLSILSGAGTFFVCTLTKDGFPVTRAVVNIQRNIGLSEVVFITRSGSNKVAQIGKNSAGSLYVADQKKFETLTLIGTLKVFNDKETKHKYWDDSFKKYGYKDKDDAFVVVRMYPKTATTFIKMKAVTFDVKKKK